MSNSQIDLNDIRVHTLHYSVYELLVAIQRDNLILPSSGTRRECSWTSRRQSLFIESILMRIPLHPFYGIEYKNHNEKIIVDGIQRILALKNFIYGGLELDLPHRPELHENIYKNLKPSFQNRISDACVPVHHIRAYVIKLDSSKTENIPAEILLDLLYRVNGNIPLRKEDIMYDVYSEERDFCNSTDSGVNELPFNPEDFGFKKIGHAVLSSDGKGIDRWVLNNNNDNWKIFRTPRHKTCKIFHDYFDEPIYNGAFPKSKTAGKIILEHLGIPIP